VSKTGRIAVAVAAIALAAAIALQAIPRLLGAVSELPAASVVATLNEGRVPPEVKLREAAAVLENAARLDPFSPDLKLNLSLVRLALAETDGITAEERAALYSAALADVSEGLKLRPSDAGGWARLAFARIRTGAPLEAVESALMTSIQMSPYDPKLMIFRVDVALSFWPRISEDLRSQTLRQLRGALTWVRNGYLYLPQWNWLHAVICRHQAQPIVEQALAADPKGLEAFNAQRNRFFSAKACAEALAAQ